ncbi:MAG: type II CRISPR RNA-guided endonuclease Cas9 [Thermoguttaceae bacterium]
MYEQEFEAIWEAQRNHYPDLLTDELKYGRRGKQSFPKRPERLPKGADPLREYGIYGLIFFQRKMYWPKSVVGRCELERREAMPPRSPDRTTLPHVKRGLMLMGEDETNSALHAAGYLRPDQRHVRQRRFLPHSPDLANPIVRQVLVEVRKVVNTLLREYVYRHGHTLGTIRVELAREAKKSLDQRRKLAIDNLKRRRAREKAAQAIQQFSPAVRPTPPTINRYLLWEEQGKQCVYCGETISMAQLFNGDTDIDHILPHWRSLDDSMANKVVCHRQCNRDKGDRTPREWLEQTDPGPPASRNGWRSLCRSEWTVTDPASSQADLWGNPSRGRPRSVVGPSVRATAGMGETAGPGCGSGAGRRGHQLGLPGRVQRHATNGSVQRNRPELLEDVAERPAFIQQRLAGRLAERHTRERLLRQAIQGN